MADGVGFDKNHPFRNGPMVYGIGEARKRYNNVEINQADRGVCIGVSVIW